KSRPAPKDNPGVKSNKPHDYKQYATTDVSIGFFTLLFIIMAIGIKFENQQYPFNNKVDTCQYKDYDKCMIHIKKNTP
ncbi:MAG: hypothetical protein K2L78_01370, partial [Muribaculaceae bacterium]|nr:hypothetical protein [Muribaculaceae bacterium]